jgi:hypothetical protein
MEVAFGGRAKQALTGGNIVYVILNRATDYSTVFLRIASPLGLTSDKISVAAV